MMSSNGLHIIPLPSPGGELPEISGGAYTLLKTLTLFQTKLAAIFHNLDGRDPTTNALFQNS